MENQLTVVNPTEYGIEKEKANELLGNLPQIKSEREEYEKQYADVIKMDIESKDTAKVARELRLKVKENRTQGIEKWHKATKNYFLKGGQFVDAIKNKEIVINERMEENLMQIEKHFELQEQKRKDELKEKRTLELSDYAEFVPFGIDLGGLTDEEYAKVFNGAKLQHKAKLEEEKQAEKERLEQERLDAIERKRIVEVASYSDFADFGVDLRTMEEEEYNKYINKLKYRKDKHLEEQEEIKAERDRLEKQAEQERELRIKRGGILKPYIIFIRDYDNLISLGEAEFEKELNDIKKEAELYWEQEKQEKQKQAKEQAELEERRQLEAKAEQERLSREIEKSKLAKAPIKEQLSVWVDGFSVAQINIEHNVKDNIIEKFNAFKSWAKSEIDNI